MLSLLAIDSLAHHSPLVAAGAWVLIGSSGLTTSSVVVR
jgi:hypothetical protein